MSTPQNSEATNSDRPVPDFRPGEAYIDDPVYHPDKSGWSCEIIHRRTFETLHETEIVADRAVAQQAARSWLTEQAERIYAQLTRKYRVKVSIGGSVSWLVHTIGIDKKPLRCLSAWHSQATEFPHDEAVALAATYRGTIDPVEATR